MRLRTADIYGGMIPSRLREDETLPALAQSIARGSLPYFYTFFILFCKNKDWCAARGGWRPAGCWDLRKSTR